MRGAILALLTTASISLATSHGVPPSERVLVTVDAASITVSDLDLARDELLKLAPGFSVEPVANLNPLLLEQLISTQLMASAEMAASPGSLPADPKLSPYEQRKALAHHFLERVVVPAVRPADIRSAYDALVAHHKPRAEVPPLDQMREPIAAELVERSMRAQVEALRKKATIQAVYPPARKSVTSDSR